MQIKVLVGLAVFGLLNIFSIRAQKTYEFTDFGYPEETIAWGAHTKVSYFIPVDRTLLLEQNSIQLDFKTSQAIEASKSFVTLIVADTPLATKSPLEEDHSLSFTVPFDADDIVSGYLKIEVLNNFSITGDVCELYNEGAVWVRRLASSSITLDYDKSYKRPKTIAQFIPKVDQLLIPENPSYDVINYAAYIQFFFEREFGKPLKIDSIPAVYSAQHSNSITLSEFEKLPVTLQTATTIEPQSDGLIELHTLDSLENASADATPSPVQTLVVTGTSTSSFNKAAQSLLDLDILQSAYTSRYSVKEGIDMTYTGLSIDQEVNLKQLGVQQEVTEGIGKLTKEFNLSRAVFGPSLTELEFNLSFKHRPINEQEQAYVNIYLDNVLKFSEALDHTGAFEESLVFEKLNLDKNTSVKVEYYYVPAGGLCIENPVSFYAQLDLENSNFKAISYQEDEDLDLFNFPENFLTEAPAIYLDIPFNRDQITALSTLIGFMNPNPKSSRHVFPKIFPVDSLKTKTLHYNPIIISSKSQSITEFAATSKPYFELNAAYYEFEKDDYSRYFDLAYADAIGTNQLFKIGDARAMFMYVPNGDAAILDLLITTIDKDDSYKRGNLVLASADEAYVFDLKNTDGIVNKDDIQSKFDIFWSNYRVFIIFGLFILMIVILIYIFQKSQESKKNIVDEN